MIFIDNKYTKLYYNIVNKAQSTTYGEDVYTESHHIVPSALGGDNSKDNIVTVTGQQHFICHWLLTKMLMGENKHKMIFGLNRMLNVGQKERYKVTGRKYQLLKAQWAKVNPFNDKEWQAKQRKNHHLGKKRSEETKRKLREAWARNREARVGVNHPRYGAVITEEHKKKQSKAMKGRTPWNKGLKLK